jgi:hypothetical protein
VLGGIAFGATVSLGALLAADLSGQEALSGLATASVTLGPPCAPSRSRDGGAARATGGPDARQPLRADRHRVVISGGRARFRC